MSLNQVIRQTVRTTRLDQQAKKLMIKERILATVLQFSFVEYAEYTIDEICNQFCVHTTKMNKLLQLRNENGNFDDGTIVYDILTYLLNPKVGGMYLNIETQKDMPSYPLVNRALIYMARTIVDQYDGHMEDLYKQLEKVASLWIVFNPPKEYENSIIKGPPLNFDVEFGNCDELKFFYDKMELKMICLGKEICTDNKLLYFLGVLFSVTLSAEEKIRRINELDSTILDEELEKEITEMCDIGLLYEEHGREQGREQGRNEGIALGRDEGVALGTSNATFKNILSTMNKLHYSLKEAMEFLDVEESEYSIYEEKYEALKH